MHDLAGQHAVVTGAGGGIGAAIALSLAHSGAKVSFMGRTASSLQNSAATAGKDAQIHVELCDITSVDSVRQAFAGARAVFGPITILVNNAGQATSAPFHKTSLVAWRHMIEINLTGTFLCCQEVLDEMTSARTGRIVNIASTAGQRGYPYVSAYVAAKHGVIGLTRALALETASKGINVNAVCPGYTDTQIVRDSVARVIAKTGRSVDDAQSEFVKSNPQGRLVAPEEVANAVAWLCSTGASSITGQSISVSGGEVM